MGLLTLLFRLPVLPVQGFVRLAELLQAEAERQLHDPARVRRQLEEAAHARAAGMISEDELSRVEYQAVARLSSGPAPAEGDRHG
jgi:hypothetical protein